MKLTTKKCTMLLIENIMQPPHRLDPVRVVTENLGPGRGRIIITCFDCAWVGYWGAMGDQTVEEFFTSFDTDYLAGNLVGSRMRRDMQNRDYLKRVIVAVQQALLQKRPKANKERIARMERLAHANDLIRAISQHGRRFFWNASTQRVAHLEMDERGRVWWVDDYRGRRVCTEKIGGHEHRWQGFSHGGTLMQLVQKMRDYIKTGEHIPMGYICPHRMCAEDGNTWGYDDDAAQALHEAVKGMPILQ